jgi:hypothetical protein
MAEHTTLGRGDDSHPRSAGRIEQFLSRVALVILALGAIAILFVVDVAITTCSAPTSESASGETSAFDMDFVTRDGRDIGGQPGWGQLELAPGTFYINHPGRAGPHGVINSDGIRGPEISRIPTRPRAIVIGGSAAFGMGVKTKASFSGALGRALPQVEVLNAGTIGYLSMQEAGLVFFRLSDLSPRLIVAFNGWNDVYDYYWWSMDHEDDLGHPGVNSNFALLQDRLVNYRRSQIHPWFAIRSALDVFLRSSSLMRLLGYGRTAEVSHSKQPRLDGKRLEDLAVRYANHMRRVSDLLESRRARLLVVLQPELGQILPAREVQALQAKRAEFLRGDRYWEFYPRVYADFRRFALVELSARGLATIDSSAEMLRVGATGDWFMDPVHLSPLGHRQMAKLLLPTVRSALDDAKHRDD